jgi:hypothetical protein
MANRTALQRHRRKHEGGEHAKENDGELLYLQSKEVYKELLNPIRWLHTLFAGAAQQLRNYINTWLIRLFTFNQLQRYSQNQG